MILYDMRLSDKYAYHWIRRQIEQGGGRARLTLDDMAAGLGCHRQTAQRICHSLLGSGLIQRIDGPHYEGYIYTLGEAATDES